MKAIDVFYLESEDISSVVVPRTKKFKIGDKIMDKMVQCMKCIVLSIYVVLSKI